MVQALQGLRVLDLTRGPAGGLATMILADFGADVLVIDPPFPDGTLQLPAAPMWRRGKHAISLDFDVETDQQQFDALCASADVLLCNWRPGALTRRGLDYDSVNKRHPHLIYAHLSGFGLDDSRSEYPGYEHVVAAVSGRMLGFSGIVDRDGPVFSALQVGIHACSQSTVSGILAALLARGDSGSGMLVETSMLQGLLPYEMGAMIGYQFPERFGHFYTRPPSPIPPLPSLYYHPTQAGDGRWVQFGNLMPHLFDNFLLVTDLIDVITDPDWDPAQMLLAGDKHEEFRARMLKRIQDRPAADWIVDCISNGGVVAASYQTTQEALSDPDIVANGHVIEAGDGMRQLGPLARLSETPANPGGAIVPGESLASHWMADPRPVPKGPLATSAPLAGIKVVEIATIIAAPFGASFLADMGADVIKVEQIGGDPFRGLLVGVGSARVNAGKRSISIDLKSEVGRAAILKLVQDADVVIHNYRPGVPERLGIGYEQINAINPRIVYLQVNGYGPDGPGSQRPSTHPIPGAAMGGVMHQMGNRIPNELQDTANLVAWASRIMRANEMNPDPSTAMVVATSALIALNARQITGMGQKVMVDMFGANAYANHDDFVDYPGKKPRAMLDELGYGLSSTYRLYRAAESQWVFLALTTGDECKKFTTILNAESISCPSKEMLSESNESLADSLAAMFMLYNADFWESLLAPKGIGCVRADRQSAGEFWLDDEQAQKLSVAVEHPAWGKYRRHGANVHFNRRVPILKPPPTAGQHAFELLGDCGYSPEEIEALHASGVIWQE